MGGDGRIALRQVAEKLGYETELIPLASFGSVTRNASLILSWLKEHSEDQIILVSLSKGGADLKNGHGRAGISNIILPMCDCVD